MKNLFLFVLIGLAGSALAQNSTKEMQYVAYLKGSKSLWLKSIDRAKAQSGKESFEYALALYGLLNNTMANKDEETFDEYLDATVDLLKSIIEKQTGFGEPKAVLSSVYGLIMAYSPSKGMFYGSRSSSLMSDALSDQPESPLVQKLYAGSKLYTPRMWGGSHEKALEAYKQSVKLYEEKDTSNDWLYLDTLVGLAMAYEKTDQRGLAKETLNKVIKLEPQHDWARSILARLEQN